MDEILYELKDHSAGLNCGRWDYIFSFIKKFRNKSDYTLPDRALVTMTQPFLKAYTELSIKTCHRRKAHAIGGMAAQIPIKNNPEANNQALAKVDADKQREVKAGHDGTWVAHPGLVPMVKEIFDSQMPAANQIDKLREDVQVTADDLLKVPDGVITEQGLRTNISVGVQYIESWLRGVGCVPLYNLMEDAATAEISRAQVWQWIRHPKGVLEDGHKITREMFDKRLVEEMDKIKMAVGKETYAKGKYELANQLSNLLWYSMVFVASTAIFLKLYKPVIQPALGSRFPIFLIIAIEGVVILFGISVTVRSLGFLSAITPVFVYLVILTIIMEIMRTFDKQNY